MAYETTDQLIAEFSHHWYREPNGNLYKLLDIYNRHMERLSDSAKKVMEWRAIQEAQGTTLDLFGEDIETYRPTKEDPPYRFLIYLKTLLAHAQGTIPSIVKITGSALGTFNGIKIWNEKTPRHVGIALPFDYVNDWPVEKFILDNLQRMLSLGYWLDEIVFYVNVTAQGYLAAGETDHEISENKTGSIWWDGWKSNTVSTKYLGVSSHSLFEYDQNAVAVWWSGWTATTQANISVGTQTVNEETEELTAI